MEFEVRKLEFEFSKDVNEIKLIGLFYAYADKYIHKVGIIIEKKEKAVEVRFKKEISLNTLNNILGAIQKNTPHSIKEIEYEAEEKKVEVEIELKA